MGTPARESEPRSGGLSLRARFALLMSAALTAVLTGAGFMLFRTSSNVAVNVQESTLSRAVQLSATAHHRENQIEQVSVQLPLLRSLARSLAAGELSKVSDELEQKITELERLRQELQPYWTQVGSAVTELEDGKVRRAQVAYGEEGLPATLYRVARVDEAPFHLLVPSAEAQPPDSALLGLVIGTVVLTIVVGALVSVWVAGQVSGPLEEIVGDIRQISTGDLNHHTRARGGGELATLARAIDRMTKNLAEARETELALSIRNRELEVAAEVREALLPQTTPELPGYEVGAAHISSQALWGDFHDFVEVDGSGRVGLLVCDVSGKGLPGALVGATARSYLRSALCAGQDLKSAMQAVNRELARDVKRGMYVSALYALVDAAAGVAHVVCAGHKIPLVRFTAADGKVRLIQPEGIALAFDKGPIFARRLEVAHVPIEPGDRLALFTSGAVVVANRDGKELGEKPLFAQVLKLGALPAEDFLARMRAALEGFAAGTDLPRAISIVTVARRS